MNEQTVPQNQQALSQDQQNTLNVQEVLNALNVAQVEVNKWSSIANTLTKCAMLLDTLVRSQQTVPQQPTTDEQLVASPATEEKSEKN